MINLKKYAKIDNFIIAGISEDGRFISFTVCDKNNERYTSKTFNAAQYAIEWANENYKDLI